jgi:hypothetical protein
MAVVCRSSDLLVCCGVRYLFLWWRHWCRVYLDLYVTFGWSTKLNYCHVTDVQLRSNIWKIISIKPTCKKISYLPVFQHKQLRFNHGTSSLFMHTTKWHHSRKCRQDFGMRSEICQCQQNAAFRNYEKITEDMKRCDLACRRLEAVQLDSTKHKWAFAGSILKLTAQPFPRRKYLWHHERNGCQECKI